jgi:hypothetical protein
VCETLLSVRKRPLRVVACSSGDEGCAGDSPMSMLGTISSSEVLFAQAIVTGEVSGATVRMVLASDAGATTLLGDPALWGSPLSPGTSLHFDVLEGESPSGSLPREARNLSSIDLAACSQASALILCRGLIASM